MIRNSFVLCLGVVVGVASCTDATGSRAGLNGSWINRENMSPAGYFTTQLTFAADGTFTDAVRSFGCYAGQSRDDLCAYTIMSGTYSIEGDQLKIGVNRIASWDRFYGADSPETVQIVNTTLFDQSHFRITALTLTLDYVTYPADAPVPTTNVFIRME